jgi:hypothetical protein
MTPIEQLRAEFEGEDGCFLLRLRVELHWDRDAFRRLTDSMLHYLQSDRDPERIDRWVAEGFWYLNHFVKDWSSHPNFPKPLPHEYYEAAYERLYDLSYWLFMGESLYEGGSMEPFDVRHLESNGSVA